MVLKQRHGWGYRRLVAEVSDSIHLEQNQILLAAKRGRTTKTPEGQRVLALIPVYHARCMDETTPHGPSIDFIGALINKGGHALFAHGPGN